MAATQIISIGISDAVSGDITVESTRIVIALNNEVGGIIPEGASAFVELKDPEGRYFEITELSGGVLERWASSIILCEPGTYRVRRVAGAVPFGVFRSA